MAPTISKIVQENLLFIRNADNDIDIRLKFLNSLWHTISDSAQQQTHDDVVSCLKDVVVQPWKGKEGDQKLTQLKKQAFEYLKRLSSSLPDDFYQKYFLYIQDLLQLKSIKNLSLHEMTDGYKKLQTHIDVCGKLEKFRLLRTLSICLLESPLIDTSLFSKFPPSEWNKELLQYTLLINNSSWDGRRVPEFIRVLSEVDDFINNTTTRYSIEDILEILINNQNTCHLDIGFIIKVLKLLQCDVESLDIVSKNQDSLLQINVKLENLKLRKICESRNITYTDEKQIEELKNLLFYSEDVIRRTLNKVQSDTEISELIDFFTIVKKSEITDPESVLRNLTPNKSVHYWKQELYSPFIQNIIRQEFPFYAMRLGSAVTSTARKNADKKYFETTKCSDKEKPTKYNQFVSERKIALNEKLNLRESTEVLHKLFHDLHAMFVKVIVKSGWSNDTPGLIKLYIKCLDEEQKVIELTNALEIINEYEVDIREEGLIETISQSTATDIQKNVHEFVVKHTFPGTYEKSVDQLTEELTTLNSHSNIFVLSNPRLLRERYHAVMDAYNGKSCLFPDSPSIKDWNEKCVRNWSKLFNVKQDVEVPNIQTLIGKFLLGQPFTTSNVAGCAAISAAVARAVKREERIAVIKRAMELASGVKARDIQLLTVILMLDSEENRGRLGQVNTGEGKTMIVAMIAAYHALIGRTVDIITSSRLLAIPQSQKQSKFFNMFDLTVSHNFGSSSGYKANIVYGTSNEFQGDILRDEFRKSGVRHGRKCDVAIVDEVDNMLVDGNNHIVMLSSHMPAMDHLESLLAAITMQVNAAADSIVVENGQAYFVERENAYDSAGNVRNDLIETYIPIEGTKRKFIEDAVEKHVRNLIRDGDTTGLDKDFPEIKIPKHLRELITKEQLKRWIPAAINAKFAYVNKEDYILKDGKVKVVDADNTGVVQQNMHWSNGLHSFIEIKHGARVNPESLTTNFISNVTFFRRYRPKVFGLTGTLGCSGTKKLLVKTYDVDTVVVPPFKFKQHKTLAPILVPSNDKNDWYRQIVKSCWSKLRNGRAVLIIMEYIRETEELQNIFEECGYDKEKLKMYKTNDDADVVEKPLDSGYVIITTNIAGRGTDIHLTKDVNKNGGLHVCVTFLPKNSRVEEQNTGRTSRTGNCGTSQFILLNTQNDIMELKKTRAKKEDAALKNAEDEIDRVTTKDSVFQKFCRTMDSIKGRNDVVRNIEKTAIEERFAIWMKIHEGKITKEGGKKKFLDEYDEFEREILRDDRNNELIRNPYMYVKTGNLYLENEKYAEAINEYTQAIDMDTDFAENARYNRGYAYIAEYGNNVSGNRYYIDKAIDDFKESRRLIRERENCLHLMQPASNGEVFSQQISKKLNLYNLQKNAIDLAIGPDIAAINKQIKGLRAQLESGKLTTKQTDEVKEAIDNYEKQKKNKGVINTAISRGRDVEISRQSIRECLPEDDKTHDDEIEEFERNGAIGAFQVSEIPPIQWSAVFSLLLIGFCQLVAGAALTVFTLGGGASFGMGLISEGISDIITAVKDGIINRNFDWATWAVEKAISLTVAVVCAGFKAIKDVAKTAYAGAKNVVSIGNKVVTGLVKEGWKLVAKRVGLELAKGVGKEIASGLVNYGVSKTIIPMIKQEIIDRVKGPIENALTNNSFVKMMLELDEINNNQYYENRIKTIGHDILKNDDVIPNVAMRIAQGVAENKIPGLATARQVTNALNAIVELSTFTSKFISKLNASIEEEAQKAKCELEKIEKKKTAAGEQSSKKEEYEVQSRKRERDTGDDIDISKARDKEEQVQAEKKIRDPRYISSEFVQVVSTNMVNIVQGKMIAPVIQYGVNHTVDSVSSSLNKSLNKDVESYRSQKRIVYHQNKGYKKLKEQDAKAKKQSEENCKKTKKVEQLIDDARSGGPSGLVHLGATSDAIDRPIEVYDEDNKLKYIIGDDKKGQPVKVQYHKPKHGETVGHYTLPGGKEPFANSKDSNMCLYNVVGEQMRVDPNKLKSTCLHTMESNKEHLAKQVDDINRLEMYSSMKLAMGGATYNGSNANDARNVLRKSTGVAGFGFDARGHPHNHASYQNQTEFHLEALSAELNKKVEVYDKHGKLLYTIDKTTTANSSTNANSTANANSTTNANSTANAKSNTNAKSTTNAKSNTNVKSTTNAKSNTNVKSTTNAKSATNAKSTANANSTKAGNTNTTGKSTTTGNSSNTSNLNASSSKGESIKFTYYGSQTDVSSDYFTFKDGKDQFKLQDPHEPVLYNKLAKDNKLDGNKLQNNISSRMNTTKVPSNTFCVEKASVGTPKTGFISESEMSFVLHHALQSQKAKNAMNVLNQYNEKNGNTSDRYKRQVVHLNARDLNLPRTAYAREWENGQKTSAVWPIKKVVVLLQHHKGKENDPTADVHVQTFYPKR